MVNQCDYLTVGVYTHSRIPASKEMKASCDKKDNVDKAKKIRNIKHFLTRIIYSLVEKGSSP